MIISCPSCGASFNIKPEAFGSSGRKLKCGKCAHLWHALPDGTVAPDAPAEDAPTPPAPAPPAAPAPDEPGAVAAQSEQPQLDSALDAPPEGPESEPDLADRFADFAAGFDNSEAEAEAEAGPGLDFPIAPAPDAVDEVDEVDEEEYSPPAEAIEEDATESSPASRAETTGRRLARRVTLSALAAAAFSIILVGGAIFLQPQITSMVPGAAALYATMGLRTDIPGLGLKIVEPKPRKRMEGAVEILDVVGEIRNETKNPLKIPTMQARLLDGDGEPLNVWQFRAAKSKIAPGETVEYKTEFRNPPNKAERLDITFTRQESEAHGGPELARSRPPKPQDKKSGR